MEMNATQIIVIILGLVTGYAVISALASRIDLRPKSRFSDSSTDDRDGGATNDENATRRAEGFPWYVVLNVDQRATADEIRQAYKVLMSQYHPDKVAKMGVELRQLAELKTQQITEAYRDSMGGTRTRN